MPALVPELVNAAVDRSIPAADLLRRALVVARRLDVPDLVEWINYELNGYRDGHALPEYRQVRGELKAENPMRGPIPLYAPPEITEAVTLTPVFQSLPELMHLAKSKHGVFAHFAPEQEHLLMQRMDIRMRPMLKIPIAQLEAIIDSVRSKILEWALQLESSGVLGEGMTFSQEEKSIVHNNNYHFDGITGSNIQIQVDSDHASQSSVNTSGDLASAHALIDLLRSAIEQGQIAAEARGELQAELATLSAQAASPKPKWAIIKATAGSIKAILENAAGSAIATQAAPYIAALFA